MTQSKPITQARQAMLDLIKSKTSTNPKASKTKVLHQVILNKK